MAERAFLSVLAGLANAALVWAVSDAINAPRIWPGTILAFASTTATTLMFLRQRKRGRR